MSGSPRESVGKKDAKKQRLQARIPCVVYGSSEQLHFTVDEKEFGRLIFTPESYLVNLSIGDISKKAILQDVQYHPVSDKVLHADFLEVTDDKPVSVTLPLVFKGTPKGVLRGGSLVKKFRKLMVRGLINDLPDHIEVDITKLGIGQGIQVKEMKKANVTFLDPANAVIVAVKTSRTAQKGAEEEEEEEGGSEPSGEGEAPAEN